MKKIFTTFLSLGMITGALAQWNPTSMKGEKLRQTRVTNFYSLDLDAIRSQLSQAQPTGKNSKPIIINLPTLDGKIEKFAVYSLPVVDKQLADKYHLGSYTGFKVDDKRVSVRFSISPYDLQAMMFRNGQYEFIEPVNKERSIYGVLPKTNKAAGDDAFECKSTEPFLSKKQIDNLKNLTDFTHDVTDFNKASDKKYRTYRLAISVTGEYTAYFGGVDQAVSAINATMTRVNGIFERDFAIHLNVQNFPQLIYTDANTDPYSNASTGAGGAWSLELQKTLTSVLGNAAYDIGHLFGRSGGGGSAGDVGNVCRNPANNNDDTSKGAAFTSPGAGGTPEGDNFDIDYVAHEMGHQFGAHHTFSHGLHAGVDAHMEPGSGSTIMGYAGITSADVQPHSDAYFHVKSVEQAQAYVNTQSCGIETSITNNPPSIAAMADKTIPKGTAFVLTAAATDPENNDITYTWEQYDTATSPVTTVTGDNTTGAKFRSLTGSELPYRYFPKLSNVLNGNLSSATDWEAVSNVARAMNFRVLVRDNNEDITQQQTQIGAQKITVGSAGPFKVISTKVYNNAVGAFTWDIAGTNVAPYSVSNVKIDYTTDNGTSWTVLAASTPNDGSENFDFASFATDSEITIRVSAIDNVFYAVGKVTVSEMANCDGTAPAGLATSAITQTGARVDWDAIADATYILRYKKATDTNWTEVNNLTTNTYTIAGLTLNTAYNLSVAAICTGTVGTYATADFTTAGINYCPAGATSTSFEKISNVTFATINNNSTSTAGYEDFTSVGNALINKGLSYPFSATFSGTSYTDDQVLVWIDFNQDGDFDDAGELVLTTAKKVAPWTGNITIPATAATGKTRMRVRLHDSSLGGNTTSCGTSTYGQVEDYTVTIGVLAVNDVKKNNIQVYPNPATDVINISNVSSKTRFEIYNVGGQLVNQGTTDGKVNVSKLTKGVYILTVESNGEKSQTKFIKN